VFYKWLECENNWRWFRIF